MITDIVLASLVIILKEREQKKLINVKMKEDFVMATKEKAETKTAAETLGDLLRKFGDTMSEILDDPKLREKAREFSEVAVDAAARTIEKKVKEEDVRARLRDVGKAASTLGKNLQEKFGTGKAPENSVFKAIEIIRHDSQRPTQVT